MAGPCSVESRSQLLETALAIKEPGPRCCVAGLTSRVLRPIPSRAWAKKGWSCCRGAGAHRSAGGDRVTSHDLVPLVARYADVLQIGARNMPELLPC